MNRREFLLAAACAPNALRAAPSAMRGVFPIMQTPYRRNGDVDYEVDEEKRVVVPLEDGIERVESALGVDNLYDDVSANLVHQFQVALKAKELYKRDKDYVVKNGDIIKPDHKLDFGGNFALFPSATADYFGSKNLGMNYGWIFTAYGTFLMRQFFVTLPKELEEAAFIDGASRWTVMWRIYVPLSLPALATLATFQFLYAWNSFVWPFIVISTGNDSAQVLTVALSQFGGRAADSPQLVFAGVTIAVSTTVLSGGSDWTGVR